MKKESYRKSSVILIGKEFTRNYDLSWLEGNLS